MKSMTLANQCRLDSWRQRYHAATDTHPDVAAHLRHRRQGINWRAREMFPRTLYSFPEMFTNAQSRLWDWYPLDTHNGHLPLIERRSGKRDG